MTRRQLLALAVTIPAGAFARSYNREVLAFYYDWYANPKVSGEWAHWPEGTAHQPLQGRYDSHDGKVVEQQLDEMKSAGITGLIVSWWRRGDFQDQGMPLVLATAGRIGLKVSLYYETAKPRQAPTPKATADDLLDVMARYGNHPAWLRVRNKPVVFVYSRSLNELRLSGWVEVITRVNRRYRGGVFFVGDEISKASAKVFDGIHSYNPTSQTANMTIDQIRAWAHVTYPKWVAAAGKRISSVTVIPGYDDTKLDRAVPRPTTSRYGGETYRVLWEEAIAANPDWVLITSWNEWHEGSEIEPSKENGDRELKATGELARMWRRKT
jgi:hypothetical protein